MTIAVGELKLEGSYVKVKVDAKVRVTRVSSAASYEY